MLLKKIHDGGRCLLLNEWQEIFSVAGTRPVSTKLTALLFTIYTVVVHVVYALLFHYDWCITLSDIVLEELGFLTQGMLQINIQTKEKTSLLIFNLQNIFQHLKMQQCLIFGKHQMQRALTSTYLKISWLLLSLVSWLIIMLVVVLMINNDEDSVLKPSHQIQPWQLHTQQPV